MRFAGALANGKVRFIAVFRRNPPTRCCPKDASIDSPQPFWLEALLACDFVARVFAFPGSKAGS